MGSPVALMTLALLPALATGAELCKSGEPMEVLACFDRLAQCAPVKPDADRLACYQAGGVAMSKGDTRMDQPGAGAHASLAATGASIEEAYPVAGGRDVEADVPALQAKVARAERDGHNYFYLWLDNGHIWREKEKSRFRYKEGTEITISKGALGANHLRVSGRSGMVLVERVK